MEFKQLDNLDNEYETWEYEAELDRPATARPAPRKCDERGIPAREPRRPIGKIAGSKASVLGVADPIGVLKRARERALDMLDGTIDQLLNARKAVCAGATPAPPLLSPIAFCWLKDGVGVNTDEIRVWTAGPFEPLRSIAEVIRRLVRVRNLLGSSGLRYSCTSPNCGTAWAFTTAHIAAGKCTPMMLIRLCRPFWIAGDGVSEATQAEFRAQTLIHEASHITHCNVAETGRTIAVPECLSQFVAATNDGPLDPNFVDRCVRTGRCRDLIGGTGVSQLESGGPGIPGRGAGRRRIFRTIFQPQNEIRLKRGRPMGRAYEADLELEEELFDEGYQWPQWPTSRSFKGPSSGTTPVGHPKAFAPCDALLDERRRLRLAVDEVKARLRERPTNPRRVAEAADVLTEMCRQIVSILRKRWYTKQGCTKYDLHLLAESVSAVREEARMPTSAPGRGLARRRCWDRANKHAKACGTC
ncbi:MAG TPA: hypothetical protein VGH32_09915 [Pirellulales bacterium]